MDDGCLMTKGNGFTLNTHIFSRDENIKLQECLEKNFGLFRTSLHRDKTKIRLYIGSDSLEKLRKVIEPYILSEFTYKLSKPRRDLVA